MKAWGGAGHAYAESYAALCAGTTDAILAGLGEAHARRVLDVGAGTGALAAALQDAGWIVSGCEPEPSMRKVAMTQHPTVEIVAGGFPALPFADDEFDAVTANFVLNHVADPRASAAQMTRVARSGGILIASIWTLSPSWFWASVCERAGLTAPAGARLPADKEFERSARGFGRMLHDGMWHTVDVAEQTWTWHASRDALWRSAEGGVASAGAFYLGLADDDRERFRRGFEELCDEKATDGVVALEHTAAVAVGRAD